MMLVFTLAGIAMNTVFLSTVTPEFGALRSRFASLAEAVPLMQRCVTIFAEFGRRTGRQHLHLDTVTKNYRALLGALALSEAEIEHRVAEALADV